MLKPKMNKIDLEEAKTKVLAFIHSYTSKHGFAPTNQEICDAYNRGRKVHKSLGAVQNWVRQLAAEGSIQRTGYRKARNIAVR